MKNDYTSEKIYVESSPYGSLSTVIYKKIIGALQCVFLKSISNNGSNVQNVCLTDKGSNV